MTAPISHILVLPPSLPPPPKEPGAWVAQAREGGRDKRRTSGLRRPSEQILTHCGILLCGCSDLEPQERNLQDKRAH